MTLDQVLEEALADRIFYRNSGGGVTMTGGEVLRQGVFAKRVLDELKRQGIHTIVETSGYGSADVLLALAESATLFYYDYKLGDPSQFKRYIGPNPNLVLDNLERLRKKTPGIVLRVPLVPGITDGEENIRTLYKLAGELNIAVIHLLPYNYSAGAKYEWIGRNYSLDYAAGCVQFPEDFLNVDHRGLDVRIIRG
jgi:pyruvate formate lyase activating enzyme